MLISKHNSFRLLFDTIASVYFIWKIYLYLSTVNGQPREPALCQLYRRTVVPYRSTAEKYMRWSDVTESVVMTLSPFCGYRTILCVQLNGEDLSCYWNKNESVSFRKCPYDCWLANKANISAVTVIDNSEIFLYKVVAKINNNNNNDRLTAFDPGQPG